MFMFVNSRMCCVVVCFDIFCFVLYNHIYHSQFVQSDTLFPSLASLYFALTYVRYYLDGVVCLVAHVLHFTSNYFHVV